MIAARALPGGSRTAGRKQSPSAACRKPDGTAQRPAASPRTMREEEQDREPIRPEAGYVADSFAAFGDRSTPEMLILARLCIRNMHEHMPVPPSSRRIRVAMANNALMLMAAAFQIARNMELLPLDEDAKRVLSGARVPERASS